MGKRTKPNVCGECSKFPSPAPRGECAKFDGLIRNATDKACGQAPSFIKPEDPQGRLL